jgi:D-alanyl-D-alanine carboxypeptidase/D-alanyl-D-alanine-endopeptidase (penicillin-binding protein 4)
MSITAFAPGWAWEDYDRSFASERSSFPLYGNVVSVYPNKSVEVSPAYFKDSVVFRNMAFRRKDVHNNFYVPTDTSDSIAIPMHMSPALTSDLLNELLNGNITTAEQMPVLDKKTIWGISRDSILKRMMVESDNFLAEQLLLAASATLSDTLESKTAISHMMERMAADLNPSPKWVDGSGLSRYNLFTPGSMVNVLNRLYLEFGKDYIFNFFPKGGVSGTLKEDFNGDPNPYIIAKSGSLGNVYCLSGYLITTSGRLLIFSYMNNHFTIERQQLKEEMALMFKFIRDNY